MIKKIHIVEFKSLLNVELELGAVNVFIGANGSGKTNLLEAIGFLGSAAEGEVNDQKLKHRGVRTSVPGLISSAFKPRDFHYNFQQVRFVADFTRDNATSTYLVSLQHPGSTTELEWRYVSEELENTGDERIRRYGSTGDTVGEIGRLLSFGKLSGLRKEFISQLKDYCVFAPSTPILRGQIADPGQRSPVGIHGGRLAETADLILSDSTGMADDRKETLLALIDWADGFGVRAPTRELVSPNVPVMREILYFKDRFLERHQGWLPAHDASEGALYVLFMYVLAWHPQAPKMFAVDNFDQVLNPRLARELARAFSDEMLAADPERQALLTTHNPLVLDGLDIRDDRIRLFAVDRNRDGSTRVQRIQISDRLAQGDERFTLSELWVMGRFGGVPDI